MVNGLVLDNANILCGVPQGSILGPLLLLMYIRDLQDIFFSPKSKLRANDTVYAADSDELLPHGKVQQDLHRAADWCGMITMDIKTTKAMIFDTKNMQKLVRHLKITIYSTDKHYVNISHCLKLKLH